MIEIDKSFAIPPATTGRISKYPWTTMIVGDSFFVECEKNRFTEKQSNLSAAWRKYKPEKNFLSRSGSKDGKPDGKPGVRVWRTK